MGRTTIDADAAAQAIEKGEPLAALRQYFTSKGEMLEFFATHQQARYPNDATPQPCIACGQPDAKLRVAWIWQTELFKKVGFGRLEALLLLFGVIGVRLDQDVIAYHTIHAVCDGCWKKIRRGHMLAKLLDGVVLFGIIVGLLVGGLGFGGVFVVASKPGEWLAWFLAGVVGCVFLALAVATLTWARRLRLPAAIRGLGGGRFRCGDAKVVEPR